MDLESLASEARAQRADDSKEARIARGQHADLAALTVDRIQHGVDIRLDHDRAPRLWRVRGQQTAPANDDVCPLDGARRRLREVVTHDADDSDATAISHGPPPRVRRSRPSPRQRPTRL